MVFDARVKRSAREVNRSSVSIAELKNAWSYTFASPVCLHGVARDNFSFLYIFTKMYWVMVNFVKIDTVEATTFKCDIPVVFYELLLCIISSQNTTNFIVLYVQCIHNYMFRPIVGHLHVVSYSLGSEVK